MEIGYFFDYWFPFHSENEPVTLFERALYYTDQPTIQFSKLIDGRDQRAESNKAAKFPKSLVSIKKASYFMLSQSAINKLSNLVDAGNQIPIKMRANDSTFVKFLQAFEAIQKVNIDYSA
ncbi:hypothetical protein FHS21_000948 [Phyllobacterium trifolii]|uniref:Uncharacterized protein n=1 Tax=Phyllobacterium trifolii TaxID=300193 RepID=A0A839U6C4_9HYPH|nr:hypothetical protein [Phyllobacterium trifolii]MBB3144552.1 hypothetical protein [Phyllobacterium trifolii]